MCFKSNSAAANNNVPLQTIQHQSINQQPTDIASMTVATRNIVNPDYQTNKVALRKKQLGALSSLPPSLNYLAPKLKELKALFLQLTQNPEGTGNERKTSEILMGFLTNYLKTSELDFKIMQKQGGHGFVVMASSKGANVEQGISVVRGEMDAVPLGDGNPSHICGHDAHMWAAVTSFMANCEKLKNRELSGNIAIYMQGKEEDGTGSLELLRDLMEIAGYPVGKGEDILPQLTKLMKLNSSQIAQLSPQAQDIINFIKNIKYWVAQHGISLTPDGKNLIKVGEIACKEGSFSAAVTSYKAKPKSINTEKYSIPTQSLIKFSGFKGHGSTPWLANPAARPIGIIGKDILDGKYAGISLASFQVGIDEGLVLGMTQGDGELQIGMEQGSSIAALQKNMDNLLKTINKNRPKEQQITYTITAATQNVQQVSKQTMSTILDMIKYINMSDLSTAPQAGGRDNDFKAGTVNYADAKKIYYSVRAFITEVQKHHADTLQGMAKNIMNIDATDEFVANINDKLAVDILKQAASELGIVYKQLDYANTWGEDNEAALYQINQVRNKQSLPLIQRAMYGNGTATIDDVNTQPYIHMDNYFYPTQAAIHAAALQAVALERLTKQS